MLDPRLGVVEVGTEVSEKSGLVDEMLGNTMFDEDDILLKYEKFKEEVVDGNVLEDAALDDDVVNVADELLKEPVLENELLEYVTLDDKVGVVELDVSLSVEEVEKAVGAVDVVVDVVESAETRLDEVDVTFKADVDVWLLAVDVGELNGKLKLGYTPMLSALMISAAFYYVSPPKLHMRILAIPFPRQHRQQLAGAPPVS